MSFADIINNEQKILEQSNGNDKVEYPKTKQKRLFFEQNQREIIIQVLPTADLFGQFFAPIRKIFLSAKSSSGKDVNSNFVLDADANPGSLLEQKITEWAGLGIIPNGFGGQASPRRTYLVNVVRIIQDPMSKQWVQERDANGQLATRVFEMPQSAFSSYIEKLKNPLLNTSGSDLSFMDINRPNPVQITKPEKNSNSKEYKVDVYSNITLPPLGAGWEQTLENLQEQATPTERLVNGDKWVQAFIDMKEGRKPNQNAGAQPAAPQPTSNPFGTFPGQTGQPVAPQPQMGQPVAPLTTGQPVAPMTVGAQPTAPMPTYQPQGQPAPMPTYTAPQPTAPMPSYPQQPVETQPNIVMPTGMEQGAGAVEPDPFDIGVQTDLSQNGGVTPQSTQPVAPTAPTTPAPTYTAPATPAPTGEPAMPAPSHATGGMPNIDDLLKTHLN
ncbi:single strand DNA binding protein [Bacillus phage CM1]|nr:single strand DNA binding protein [Bacillus phage CM1]